MYQNNFRQNNNSNVILNRIYVSGIPLNASQDELKYYFSSFGPVKDARIITDQATGTSRGFGFVTYDNNDDAAKVLGMKDQDLMFQESKLSINRAYRNHNNNNNNQRQRGFNNFNQGGHGGFDQGGMGHFNAGGFQHQPQPYGQAQHFGGNMRYGQ